MKNIKQPRTLVLALLCAFTFVSADDFIQTAEEHQAKQINHGKELIIQALEQTGKERIVLTANEVSGTIPAPSILLATEASFDSNLASLLEEASAPSLQLRGSESFSIRVEQDNIFIVGKDSAGTMYGAMEVAEVIRIGGIDSVTDLDQAPYMKMRGTKFNIPLDVRTPTYTESSDAAQNNMAEMWNFEFWKEYIDLIANHRYNYISLWNLNPYPSMIHVPDYPEVSLQDVRKSTFDWEEFYPLQGIGYDRPELLNNYETLVDWDIHQKMEFWRKVMAYGKSRNVDFYVVTWNIFTNGIDGKYGIDNDIQNGITRDYFRKAIKQMFVEYPDLAGVGLTTGENMPGGTFEEKEDWAFDTYGKGVLDAVKEMPGRKIRLIHRQHQTGASQIASVFEEAVAHPNVDFIFSFKYAKAHVYSSTIQPYYKDGFIQDIGELKTIWTLRNDDVFYFRWGAPDFVREFIQNIPYDISQGYYYGSDQYVWGREFLNKFPSNPRRLEIDKHWYQWMLWGRLGYDPEMSNERFADLIAQRFPDTDSSKLFTAWQEASMIYPKTTGFHWGALDFQWYIESSQSLPGAAQTPTGFHDINRFITLPPHPGTDYLSIPDYVKALKEGNPVEGTTPDNLANQIHEHSDRALELLDDGIGGSGKEFVQTLHDIRIIANLGKHFAHKIDAALALHQFRTFGGLEYQEKVSDSIRKSAEHWRRYASLALSQHHNPLWTNRVGHVNWRNTMNAVLYDLRMTGTSTDLTPMEPTPGGTIFEAEKLSARNLEVIDDIPGATGGKCVHALREGDPVLRFEYNSRKEGLHMMEMRYSRNWGNLNHLGLTVNGEAAPELIVWPTGSKTSWAWDQVPVRLKKGKNKIELEMHHSLNIDHFNFIPAQILDD
ncbi:MAG: carbohydrate-binding family 6 protein [Opitutales bacterium]|nr:carbohydrate-binding family 6 protein [Opitutales bacterium]